MKIELPLETWADVFGFLTRPRRAEIVSNIGDRQFVSFVQFSLHKCGDISLGQQHLQIISQNRDNGPAIVEKDWDFELPLADGPMPENIKNFNTVIISYFDESVLAFLKEFERQSLFSYVNLKMLSLNKECSHVLLEIMNKVMPLFNSIETIDIGRDMRALLQDHYSEHEQYKRVLKSARAIETGYDSIVDNDWFCNWLHMPREDGKPRYLSAVMKDCNTHSIYPFVEQVKKEFMGAKEPVSFFVTILIRWLKDDEDGDGDIQTFTMENLQTHEKLVINEGYRMEISRYPIGPNKNLEEEIEKDWKYEDRTVEIYITKWKPYVSWTDVLVFLPRSQLAELGWLVGNKDFARSIQFVLHEVGEITIDKLHIISKGMENGLPIFAFLKANQELPLTIADMPNNFKNFRELHLSYYDHIFIFYFLRDLQHKSLFTNVNLIFKITHDSGGVLVQFLVCILPMIASIESISIHSLNGNGILKFLKDEFAELAMPMLTATRCLYACYQSHDDSFTNWLHTPREDGKARVLVLRFHCNPLIFPFIEHVKKDFLGAKEAVSFFIHIWSMDAGNIPPLTVYNIHTRERLVINRIEHRCLRITRCPMEATEEWMDEMGKYTHSEYRNIIIDI